MTPGKDYRCRARVANAFGIYTDSDASGVFSTPPSITQPPSITSIDATDTGLAVSYDRAIVEWSFADHTLVCGDLRVLSTSSPQNVELNAENEHTCFVEASTSGFETVQSTSVTYLPGAQAGLSIPMLYIATCETNPRPGCPGQ